MQIPMLTMYHLVPVTISSLIHYGQHTYHGLAMESTYHFNCYNKISFTHIIAIEFAPRWERRFYFGCALSLLFINIYARILINNFWDEDCGKIIHYLIL